MAVAPLANSLQRLVVIFDRLKIRLSVSREKRAPGLTKLYYGILLPIHPIQTISGFLLRLVSSCPDVP